jgi:hypothetical protein
MLARPALTVVIASTHPWPSAQACLEILAPQCRALNAELLVGDSTGEGLPDPLPDSLGGVRCMVIPGASIFDLRAQCTESARGEIIAWTEDHCRPAEDWCRRILKAHEAQPDAHAIGGAILNGSTGSLMDWANFLCTFAPFMPPLERSRIGRVPAAANISFKRCAIPAGPLAAGRIELTLEAELWSKGKIGFDERILVSHVQSWGFWGTPHAHFHNGRSTTGLRAADMGWGCRLGRLLVCGILPLEILRTVIMPLAGKPGIPYVRCLPLIAGLAMAHSAGEFTGLLLRSAGSSPLKLE